MFPITRENLVILTTIVCALGLIFVLMEMKKAKQDIDNFKIFSEQVIKRLSPKPIEIMEEQEQEEEQEPTEEVKDTEKEKSDE